MGRSVAIIGAGAAGLSAARHLLAAGHRVTIYEIGSKIGGLWVYDNDNQLSAAYRSLHINSEPAVTHYPGFPFPEGTSLFPSHWEVSAYLNSFADHFHLREAIRFRTRVTSVEPVAGAGQSRWRVKLEGGAEEEFDAVVIASGHQGVPAHPDLGSEFSGQYLHSHDYREPEPFRGQRVLVIGLGNSGLDIAADLALVAAKTYVAVRSPVLIMPRMIFGLPAARTLGRLIKPWMPWPLQRSILRAVSRVFFGRMEMWGLRTPEQRTHPASNATFMAHVAYRKIFCKPGVASVAGQTVTFTDGSTVEVDTIIAATGYEIALPFLPPALSPVVERRLDLYRRVIHPAWPGLYFVGFFNANGGGNISLMDVQTEWIAALLSGKVRLPDEAAMRAAIAAELVYHSASFPSAPRYGLELDPLRYRRQVAEDMARVVLPDSVPPPAPAGGAR